MYRSSVLVKLLSRKVRLEMPRLVGLRMSKTRLPYALGSVYGVLLQNYNVRRELVALMVQLN